MSEIAWHGTQSINCKFINCNFNNSNIKSSWFKETCFNSCDLSFTDIIDNTFNKNEFNTCKFEKTSIATNTIIDTLFKSIIWDDGNIISNIFTNCSFEKMKIDCEFYFNLFEEAFFLNTMIDAYYLGFQYGLTKRNYKENKLVFLSEDLGDLNKIMEKMQETYLDRKLLTSWTITKSIINNDNPGKLMYDLVYNLIIMIQESVIIQAEELRFIRRIIETNFNSNTVAPLYFFKVLNKLRFFSEKINQLLLFDSNIKSEFLVLFNYINFATISFYNKCIEFQNLLKQKADLLEDKNLIITYNFQPSIRLHDFVSSFNVTPPLVIKTEIGSFIEWLSIAMSSSKDWLEYIVAVFVLLGEGKNILKAIKSLSSKKKEVKESGEIQNEINIYQVNYIIQGNMQVIEKVINNTIENDVFVEQYSNNITSIDIQ
jgi:hypothetical protein